MHHNQHSLKIFEVNMLNLQPKTKRMLIACVTVVALALVLAMATGNISMSDMMELVKLIKGE